MQLKYYNVDNFSNSNQSLSTTMKIVITTRKINENVDVDETRAKENVYWYQYIIYKNRTFSDQATELWNSKNQFNESTWRRFDEKNVLNNDQQYSSFWIYCEKH